MELGRRVGAQDGIEELAGEVGLEGLVRLGEGVDIENEIVHGRLCGSGVLKAESQRCQGNRSASPPAKIDRFLP